MLELFAFDYQGRRYALWASHWSGLECLKIDGREVSRRRSLAFSGHHELVDPDRGPVALHFHLDLIRARVSYALGAGGEVLCQGSGVLPDPLSGAGSASAAQSRRAHWPLKTLLALATFTGWAWMWNEQVALILIASILVHEQGHLWAMRRCTLGSGGLYLIPFIGGLVTGERPRTPAQEAFVVLMGPVFGLVSVLVLWLLHRHTASPVLGTAAVVGAAINLLPIYPLDGGRIGSVLLVPGRRRSGLALLLAAAGAGVGAALWLDWYLLAVVAALGVLSLASAWRTHPNPNEPRLDAPGTGLVLLGYFGTTGALIVLLAAMAQSGFPAAGGG